MDEEPYVPDMYEYHVPDHYIQTLIDQFISEFDEWNNKELIEVPVVGTDETEEHYDNFWESPIFYGLYVAQVLMDKFKAMYPNNLNGVNKRNGAFIMLIWKEKSHQK